MKDLDLDALKKRFDALSVIEQRRLLKRATKQKKSDQREQDAGTASYKIPRNQRRSGRSQKRQETTAQEYALRILATELVDSDEFVYEGEGTQGTVVSTYSGWCDVDLGDRVVLCHLVGHLNRTQKTSLAVGDRVIAHPADAERWIVTSVLPRKTRLSRPDPHNEGLERVIAANVDIVGIVVSVVAPQLHPRVIDRMWLGVERGGAKPIVIVNKVDLLDEEGLEETGRLLAPYHEANLEIIFASAEANIGIEELRERLMGSLCTFVGHSGVGKSSLLNALFPTAKAVTGAVREADGRGRHTTTNATLYDVGPNTRLIDTPGIRSFGLWRLEEGEIQAFFPEFDELRDGCHFANCTHIHEPDCDVRDAVEAGTISAFRYETYVRLMGDYFDD